ncbi:MAG: FAD/NAD(P)-binding protein [Candidatus Zixiibacteriota bacterium]|nr:MAG: FAD/NAD(P)-binding protein [candidate division Zixibacteria bacterium]
MANATKEIKGRIISALDFYTIKRVKRETRDTFTMDLVPRDNGEKISFRPGQFNMLYHFGFGEVPISISGDPNSNNVITHTIRAVGNVTKAIKKLKPGDSLGIRGPFGNAWPVDEARGDDLVIVAGGIGLASLRPALYQALSGRKSFGKIVLLYGARTPDDILYKHELEKWRSRFDLNVDVTVDRGISGWAGNVGVVTTIIPRTPFDPYHTTALVCGPEIMMRYVIIELQKKGVPDDKIFVSMERNMKCGIGLCGHCQIGPTFVCKNGPVYSYDQVKRFMGKREI